MFFKGGLAKLLTKKSHGFLLYTDLETDYIVKLVTLDGRTFINKTASTEMIRNSVPMKNGWLFNNAKDFETALKMTIKDCNLS